MPPASFADAPVLQRILGLTAAIWHNDHTSQPVRGAGSPDERSNEYAPELR